ncbi:MAG: HigA family addiction module antidote protein [Candidatus Moeniiplasma glomeromycotorum]|nr:HigA family addiction module antidote protein [Candidatus Moeniiplasma glomeromycotorum]MCE8169335.1 HigA family addiction module antidote protein [Candidatus Moeniiplasma glomeromycotorum]
MSSPKLPPIHPGQTLERQFFKPLENLTREKLAQDLHLPLYQLEDLIAGRSPITLEMAYRLGCYFQLEPEVFLNLQLHYDLEVWKDRQEVWIRRQIKPYRKKYSAMH